MGAFISAKKRLLMVKEELIEREKNPLKTISNNLIHN